MPSQSPPKLPPKQPLKCLKCNHYLGRYRRETPSTIELELYCFRCKGHTQFTVVDGLLTASGFVPNPPRPWIRQKPGLASS